MRKPKLTFDKISFALGINLPNFDKAPTEKKKIPESKENMILDVLRDKNWTSKFKILDLVKEDYGFNMGFHMLDFHLISLIQSEDIEKKYGEHGKENFVPLDELDDSVSLRKPFYRLTQGGIRRLNRAKFKELREVDQGFDAAPTPA
jgi:hypothetical protein